MDGALPESNVSAADYYDAMAGTYHQQSMLRAPYLQSIDRVVVDWCQRRSVRSILDVGCGDGRRLARLAEATSTSAVGIDVSRQMVTAARRRGVEAYVADIADRAWTSTREGGFDLVLSLWNVLGHVDGPGARATVLQNIRASLVDDGIVILDVNNRYNATAYGWPRVVRNITLDTMRRSTSGDFMVACPGCDPPVSTRVHLFTGTELTALLTGASLRPVQTIYVDYERGTPSQKWWRGQLCVVARPCEQRSR